MVRTNKGRQKIEIKKITRQRNRQVTFSKRKLGLFKKASELCTLCGAEIFMIIFSPGGKAYSFGNPNVYDMIHRNNQQLVNDGPSEDIQRLNEELTEVLAIQEKEINKRKVLESIRANREKNEICYENPNHLISALEGVRGQLASSNSYYPSTNFYQGESSGNISQNFIGGAINETRLDVFGQTRMLDLSAFTINHNYRASVGFYANGPSIPENNLNYVSNFNINQNNYN